MSELAILLDRVLSMSKFSTSLLKCLLEISASSSLPLMVLLLLFKKILLRKEKTNSFQNFLLSETTLWSSFPKKCLLVLRSNLTHKFLCQLKRLLDSLFRVFKNLFLSFDLFMVIFFFMVTTVF